MQIKSENIVPEDIPIVTVIIPTYNCGNYIRRAIDSVLAQGLKNLEVIVVDDASTDETQSILRENYGGNPAVRVIRQKENKKQGAARNAGLDVANGKYIFFLDADDWLEGGSLIHLVSIAEKEGSEIVACGLRKVWEDGKKETYHAFAFECSGKKDALSRFADYSIGSIVCGKLFLREFIEKNNFRFVVPYWHEDVMFAAKAVYECNGFISVKDEYYNYFQRNSSTVNAIPTPFYLESYIKLYVDMIEFIKRIDICSDDDGRLLCQRLLKAHCSNELLPKFVRYANTRSSVDWEFECRNACFKIIGVTGFAVADYLIHATNMQLTNATELERTKTELERINSSRGWKLLEKIYSSRGWKLVILLQRFAIQRNNP